MIETFCDSLIHLKMCQLVCTVMKAFRLVSVITQAPFIQRLADDDDGVFSTNPNPD